MGIYIFNFVLLIILYFLLIKIAEKIQLVDKANLRKKHSGLIPLIGGPLIFTSFII